MNRARLNPVLLVSFVLVAATGILLLLHIRVNGIRSLHEVMSIVFVISGVVHIGLNSKPLLKYLKSPWSIITIVLALALTVLAVLHEATHERHRIDHQRTEHAD